MDKENNLKNSSLGMESGAKTIDVTSELSSPLLDPRTDRTQKAEVVSWGPSPDHYEGKALCRRHSAGVNYRALTRRQILDALED